jgi:uncharacterized protein
MKHRNGINMTSTNPLVVITGAIGGVGAATAARLHATGFRVVGIDLAEPVGDPIFSYYSCDMTDGMAVQQLVQAIVATHGIPDVWVNNAGIGRWGPFDPAHVDSERAEMAVNYHGSVNGIRAILPHWRERGGGHLIQITSSSALFPAPNMATYAASKAAIRAFIQSLRVERRGTGVAITEIVPNTINTPMSAGSNRHWIPKIASIRPDLTPEQVATAIHHAILKRPREVHVPGLVTPFHWLSVFFPSLLDRLVGWGQSKK